MLWQQNIQLTNIVTKALEFLYKLLFLVRAHSSKHSSSSSKSRDELREVISDNWPSPTSKGKTEIFHWYIYFYVPRTRISEISWFSQNEIQI